MEPLRADVVAALQVSGYRVGGPIGRGASGAVWTATGPDGVRVVVRLLPAPPTVAERRAQQARLAHLRRFSHGHLARLLHVLDLASGERAIVVEAVEGTSLDAVADARARFTEGEVTTLLVPLAEALGELHALGLSHGDVSAANVVLTVEGRPVLVDLAGAVCPREGSTPRYAAPERGRGVVGLGSSAGDVYALATVGAELLGEQHEPGPVSQMRAVLARASALDAAARPSTAEFAAAVFDAAPPEPITMPDGAVLARASLTRLSASVHQATTLRPGGQRRRRPSRRLVLAAVAAAGVVATGTLLAPSLGLTWPGGGGASVAQDTAPLGQPVAATSSSGQPQTPAEDPGTSTDSAITVVQGSDPVAAARALTELRGHALVAADRGLLERVTTPDGAARTEDLALLDGLVSAGTVLRPHGDALVEVLEAAEVVAGTTQVSTSDGRVVERRVALSSRVLAHDRVRADGTSERVEGEAPRDVVLVLVDGPHGWGVSEVEPAPASR